MNLRNTDLWVFYINRQMDFDAFKKYIYIYEKVYHRDKIKIKSTMLRNIFWQSFR